MHLLYEFRNEVLRSNNQLGEVLGGEVSASEQLSSIMEKTRSSPLENRKKVYLKDRVDEQRKWYADKSGLNKRNGKRFFILLVCLQVIAIVLVLSRIAYPTWAIWPTDVFVVMAGGALTWIQVKNFMKFQQHTP